MSIPSRLAAIGLLLSVSLMIPSQLRAQAINSAEPLDGTWQHSITGYLFLPFSTKGTSVIDGTAAQIDLDLGEVLDLLQGAASARYEGWRGDFGVIAEGYYVSIGDDTTLPTLTNIDVNTEQFFFTLQGAYRFAHGQTQSGHRYAWDVAAGLKYNSLTQEIDITGGPNVSLGGTEDWVEPIVSLRYAADISDDWQFGARVDLSGFGVGGDDLQYLVLAGFQWNKWERTSLRFGYQFYGIDFSTTRPGGVFAYDIDQNGPYLSLSYRF